MANLCRWRHYVIKRAKYARQCLAEAQYRFNRRFQFAAMMLRGSCPDQSRTPPTISMAEVEGQAGNVETRAGSH